MRFMSPRQCRAIEDYRGTSLGREIHLSPCTYRWTNASCGDSSFLTFDHAGSNMYGACECKSSVEWVVFVAKSPDRENDGIQMRDVNVQRFVTPSGTLQG